MLGGGRFEVDAGFAERERARDAAADLFAPGRDPRRLREQCEVGIEHPLAAAREQLQGVADELAAIGAAPLRIAVREVLADVAQARGPEQRIHQCVQQHIAVGVRHDPVAVRNAHPAQHERIAGPEGMHIES